MADAADTKPKKYVQFKRIDCLSTSGSTSPGMVIAGAVVAGVAATGAAAGLTVLTAGAAAPTLAGAAAVDAAAIGAATTGVVATEMLAVTAADAAVIGAATGGAAATSAAAAGTGVSAGVAAASVVAGTAAGSITGAAVGAVVVEMVNSPYSGTEPVGSTNGVFPVDVASRLLVAQSPGDDNAEPQPKIVASVKSYGTFDDDLFMAVWVNGDLKLRCPPGEDNREMGSGSSFDISETSPLEIGEGDKIEIKFYDYDRFSSDDDLGGVLIIYDIPLGWTKVAVENVEQGSVYQLAFLVRDAKQ